MILRSSYEAPKAVWAGEENKHRWVVMKAPDKFELMIVRKQRKDCPGSVADRYFKEAIKNGISTFGCGPSSWHAERFREDSYGLRTTCCRAYKGELAETEPEGIEN